MPLPAGARILDFGCGKGASVEALVDAGYDAYGVDVSDHWNEFDSVPPKVRNRLSVIRRDTCLLPFPNDRFDFCFSDQVMEHVFNYYATFRELARVLKPSAISAHRFPGPNKIMESHINVPIPWLCYHREWLTLWAFAGWRGRDQDNFTWRETVEHNEMLMRFNSYPTKGTLRFYAETNGLDVEFREAEEFAFRRTDTASRILKFLSPLMSRYMVLRPRRR